MRTWILLGCLLTCAARAAPVVIDLRDGSHLVGDVDLGVLSLSTQFGAMKLKLSDIVTVSGLDEERVSVRAANGDTLTGVPTPPKLELKTAFGKVTIPFALVTRLELEPTGSTVASAPPSTDPPHDTSAPAVTFRCAQLKGVVNSGQTTGGSVFVWEVSFTSGPSLLLTAATSEPGASAALARVVEQVGACKGSARQIVVKDAKFVSPTHTTTGARKGWAVFYPNARIQ